MGTAPPTNYEAPPPKTESTDNAGMADSPPADKICGFTLPSLDLSKLFPSLPNLPSPKLPELLNLVPSLGINCSSANPLKVDVPWGANRPGNPPPTPPPTPPA